MRIRPTWRITRASFLEPLYAQSTYSLLLDHQHSLAAGRFSRNAVRNFSPTSLTPSNRPTRPELPKSAKWLAAGIREQDLHDRDDRLTKPEKREKGSRERDEETRHLALLHKWIVKLEPYLPAQLRLAGSDKNVERTTNITDALQILKNAEVAFRYDHGTLLVHMVITYRRDRASLYLMDQILHYVAGTRPDSKLLPPSNILWPTKLSSAALKHPVLLESVIKGDPHTSLGLDADYENMLDGYRPGLDFVWKTLALLVVEAANLESEQAEQVMTVVYKVLAKAHNLNLIPDNVYAHSNLLFSSAVQRPPILHLLSSRILTTLSDATWRSQQDEAIAQAAELGVSYRETQDPPGGRFRLKVRPLEPAVWLEFVLWCCVESNCAEAGAKIVERLGNDKQDPWFAVNWTSGGARQIGAHVDWKRVRSRTGGTVGRIEGYSGEAPLAKVPPRTISTEVVLSLVESLIDSARARRANYDGRLQRKVKALIGFLEPHGLPEEYFDYLTARILSMESIDATRHVSMLQSWADTMIHIRDLESSEDLQPALVGLNFRTIIQHSDLHAGMLHQVLHGFVCANEAPSAIKRFDDIQSLADESKMQAIASFINIRTDEQHGFFDASPTSGNVDFTHSHGQLPLYRLAAFLNVLTENKIVPLAEWMIYSTDADGPLIPQNSFGRVSIAYALARFAGANDDPRLLQHVLTAVRRRRLKPPVTFLRSMANAQMQCNNFRFAGAYLRAIVGAVAGGYHPDNLACAVACILRLDAKAVSENLTLAQNVLSDAVYLVEGMLDGRFEASPGDFYIVQRLLFKQQIGFILRVCDSLSSFPLQRIAEIYRGNFRVGNMPALKPSTFNILLGGIVDVQGSIAGKRVWEMFCTEPSADDRLEESPGKLDREAKSEGAQRVYDNSNALVSEENLYPTKAQIDLVTAETSGNDEPNELGRDAKSSGQVGIKDVMLQPPNAEGISWDQSSLTGGFKDFFSRPSETRPEKRSRVVEDENSATQEPVPPTPIVVPNIQTLRIIFNKAIAEHSDESADQEQLRRARAVALWARGIFIKFGRGKQWDEIWRVSFLSPRRDTDESLDDSRESMGATAPESNAPRIATMFRKVPVGGLRARLPEQHKGSPADEAKESLRRATVRKSVNIQK